MSDAQVLGEATTADEALQLAEAISPDIILAATALADGAVIPLLTELRSRHPDSCIVVLIVHIDVAELAVLFDTRIQGFVLWTDMSPELLRFLLVGTRIRNVVVSSEAVLTAIGALLREQGETPRPLSDLTERERVVLEGLALGRTRKEIARMEGVSLRTVKRNIAGLREKLDAPDLFRLGMKAAQMGLVP